MYFVDREKIFQLLLLIEENVAFIETLKDENSKIAKLAFERACQYLLDGVLDVGNLLIDGFIMRDPGSLDDIIDILVDEQVIPASSGAEFKQCLPYRKKLCYEYVHLPFEELKNEILLHLPFFNKFPTYVRAFLEREDDSVTAFKNRR